MPNLETTLAEFNKFKSSGSPTNSEIVLKSRGKHYPLNFDLQLVDSKIAIVATIPRIASEAVEVADEQPVKKRR